MKVNEIRGLDDVNCELDCEFTDNEIKILINYAVNTILKEQIKKEEKSNE
jgi:hypothetical protein